MVGYEYVYVCGGVWGINPVWCNGSREYNLLPSTVCFNGEVLSVLKFPVYCTTLSRYTAQDWPAVSTTAEHGGGLIRSTTTSVSLSRAS